MSAVFSPREGSWHPPAWATRRRAVVLAPHRVHCKGKHGHQLRQRRRGFVGGRGVRLHVRHGLDALARCPGPHALFASVFLQSRSLHRRASHEERLMGLRGKLESYSKQDMRIDIMCTCMFGWHPPWRSPALGVPVPRLCWNTTCGATPARKVRRRRTSCGGREWRADGGSAGAVLHGGRPGQPAGGLCVADARRELGRSPGLCPHHLPVAGANQGRAGVMMSVAGRPQPGQAGLYQAAGTATIKPLRKRHHAKQIGARPGYLHRVGFQDVRSSGLKMGHPLHHWICLHIGAASVTYC